MVIKMKERRLGLIIYKDYDGDGDIKKLMKVAYHPEGNEEARDRAIRIAFKYIMGRVKNRDTEYARFKRCIVDDWVIVIE